MYRSQGRDHLPLFDIFRDQGYIEDVLGLIKTGKEASVYCCSGGPEAGCALVAAKVYRGRQYRFKNDAVYQQARAREMGLPGRVVRAMARKSEFGREMQSATWHHHEFATLQTLYKAGADVPRPIAVEGDVTLMEYLGDEDAPAPMLVRAELDPTDAPRLFERLLDNIELMLAVNRVHGDLSPHNVLYWQDRLWIIDLPQATDPRFNESARELFFRDVANVCRHFEAYGIKSDAWGLAYDLWRRFERGEL